ncbi:P-loop containing nucleoside triphosphate hydrolase protein [Fistulina hepatica ATCC 64428]|uniref:p-loop containing nucleoside triphosphate hydrolase protein n=1 Tax=Fistulina hepatica ATCC 64428 TaxID=1128425 RepID=A0A0D7A573_9AGAR|nr:P-loop containing nucleoside triphosphate hydrolase protein [Fistulina hepatica ATCC 64428]
MNLPSGFFAKFNAHVVTHGGWMIYTHGIARFVGLLALLSLSTASLVLDEAEQQETVDVNDKWGSKHEAKNQAALFAKRQRLEAVMCMVYLYTCILSIVSLSARPAHGNVIKKHLVLILLVTFGVYFWRDVFPLATYKWNIADPTHAGILWAKVIVLSITAIIIPLVVPRQYVPFDPDYPAEPSPEQTASLFSLLSYTFLDPLIKKAYALPHLSPDQFPPMSDYDFAKNLRARSFKHLDTFSGAPNRYMFWGFMSLFRREYLTLVVVVTLLVMASFVSPIGINRLLHYLETGGVNTVMRPWFWLMWLVSGPVITSLAFQYYIYVMTGTLVRTQSIVTQLVFEHALRIRMKAELPDSRKNKDGDATPSSDKDLSTPTGEPVSSSPAAEDSASGSSGDDSLSSTTNVGTSSQTTLPKAANNKNKDQKTKVEDHTSSSSSKNLTGRINNLVTTDLENLVDGRDFLLCFLLIPLQITLCVVFLYNVLGWSAFVGLATMVALFPLPGYVAILLRNVQAEQMKRTDARVQTVTETMSVLRMVKLFGWEGKMQGRIDDKRREELKFIRKRQFLNLANGILNFFIPTVIMKQPLNASIVFSSMTVFDMLRGQLHMGFAYFSMMITAKVSLDRVDSFLRETELLDQFTPDSTANFLPQDEHPRDVIGFRDATFTWSADTDGALTPSKRKFLLKVEDEVLFRRGKINLITGPTGSGKTSLLMALLGEMHFVPTTPNSWYNLPRDGGVAYAAQESWVLNETIKENIIFGNPYDEARYKKVLYQCGLMRDLELFDAGDETEVGAKGLTLSGGQKARVTLARAIYSSAEIILLDDVLAALDVHTSKWVVDKCFAGDLSEGRTILLVTHNVALVKSIASHVVVLGTDGLVVNHGSFSAVFAHEPQLVKEMNKEEEVLEKTDEVDVEPTEIPKGKGDGKLVVAEEVELGHLGWDALKLYLLGLSGSHYLVFFSIFFGSLLVIYGAQTVQTYWLGIWAAQYEDHRHFEVDIAYYLGIYVALLLSAMGLYCIVFAVYVLASIKASKSLHLQLVHSVLNTTLRWLDTTPTSRIIARCTADIRSVDGPVSMYLFTLCEMSLEMACKLAAVILMTPVFLFPGLLVAVAGGWLGQIYIKAQLSVKREMSNARAPVLGHLGAAIEGLTSIRAYSAQDRFRQDTLQRIDRYTAAGRIFYNLNRWVCIRIETLGAVFATAVATWFVYYQSGTSSDTGFSLNMAVGFSGMILWWVRILNMFEVEASSLERIQQYLKVEQEPESTPEGVPPAYWPASGDLVVEKLSARYSPDGPKVLRDISFVIKSGERVGVVGRTGSGKSSLTLSLLRCIYTEGEMWYDGRLTTNINLDDLRSNITIIPQVPELLSGTLRQNLDPFDQYDDATLNDALRAAGLFALQSEMDEDRITLDSAISSGGSNLSVGQRQILALARAIVRNSKLLILDEATSAIDYKTDNIIQTSLRNELKKDVTLITIAHRLQTIMDADKIMVLDAGEIVEYDSPRTLLKLEDGHFRALVDESGDKEHLYAIVEGHGDDH